MLSLNNPPLTAGQGGGLQESASDLPAIYFWLNVRLYQTNLMQEFFFEAGLQDI